MADDGPQAKKSKQGPPVAVMARVESCVLGCVEIKILRRVRAESSRRPPRHREKSPDARVDF